MPGLAHYLIFHPDSNRERAKVIADAIINKKLRIGWEGDIWVDKRNIGNEDPFVFNEPWLYSYCHTSQLRRNEKRTDNFINSGSYLVFCSANSADNGIIQIDTVFVVGELTRWGRDPSLTLPAKFSYLLNDRRNPLWRRHFRFPFLPGKFAQHKSVTHTYLSKSWKINCLDYSFLPLGESNERISFKVSNLSNQTASTINERKWGKYPVLFTQEQLNEILEQINRITSIRVIRQIHEV